MPEHGQVTRSIADLGKSQRSNQKNQQELWHGAALAYGCQLSPRDGLHYLAVKEAIFFS
jgi:hypothetical protein